MGAYNGLSTAEMQAELSNLRAARSALITGKQITQASYSQGDGAKSVTYRPGDLSFINMGILELEQKLGIGCGRRRIGIRHY